MITKGLSDNGVKVYILGRRKDKLDEAAKHCPARIIPLVADVNSKKSLADAAAHIQQETGFINLLICNSGTYAEPIGAAAELSVADFARRALERDPAEWNGVLSTNITAVHFTAMTFLELLDAGNQKGNAPGRSSQIIVTSSIAGYLRNPVSLGPYPISKAGATHLVKILAGSLAPYKIRVNAIAPGLFPSDLAAGMIAKAASGADDFTADDVVPPSHTPARRIGRETDMAGSIIYMASAAGAFLNGNVNVIDGGRISQLPSTY